MGARIVAAAIAAAAPAQPGLAAARRPSRACPGRRWWEAQGTPKAAHPARGIRPTAHSCAAATASATPAAPPQAAMPAVPGRPAAGAASWPEGRGPWAVSPRPVAGPRSPRVFRRPAMASSPHCCHPLASSLGTSTWTWPAPLKQTRRPEPMSFPHSACPCRWHRTCPADPRCHLTSKCSCSPSLLSTSDSTSGLRSRPGPQIETRPPTARPRNASWRAPCPTPRELAQPLVQLQQPKQQPRQQHR
mmetsp:Transcript_26743/g.88893  ORF Transcript_26743/g.88893 Transcript_26743/m.88893 type:complete len:246 (+) Transcript_26743:766-1503(+)